MENCFKNKKLLIVEDDTETGNLLINIFSTLGFNVELSNNGSNALDILNKKKFDIVLTDIEMPELNGFELIDKIKEKSIHNNNIIILSTHTISYTNKYINNKDITVFSKPFNLNELITTIKTKLSE